MIERSTIFKTSDQIRFRIIDGEAVVVQQQTARVLNLNEVGTRILQLLDGTNPIENILHALHEEYETSPDTLEADVLSYLDELVAVNVIEPVG